ncbi:hypothetical protein D9615_000817 [Tricholomella constricta]|uniref:Amidase domain-containing protein n=1 Tax=Tricholomella constricta TaxID=117010 RepID=A0A8H5HR40_9AGAR|nr:hypothetical protein D9615_000817 [Tricholomella constricta]
MRAYLRNISQRLAVISLACVLVAATAVVVDIDASGTILRLHDGLPYYIPHLPLMTVDPNKHSGLLAGFTPVTSLRAAYSPITKAYLESQLTMYRTIDDVWSDQFLEALFITYDGQSTGFFDDDAEKWLESIGLTHLYVSNNIRYPILKTLRVSQLTTGPSAGPYITTPSHTSGHLDLHSVYRLHKDDYETFLYGVIPNPDGGWTQTNIVLEGSDVQYIPVPSRVSLLTKALPLSGTRFGLKDIFDAQGVPTGAGSLAYARVHPSADENAPSLQRLLDLGAMMVGKTRTSQFAHGAAPWEYLDIPYSWNPRGDGHLTASASSSGSACAIAGYEWLEFTVGSDTRGSVRKPAAHVGAYGMRPSHGSLDLTGVVTLSEEMDTAGFFSRDPQLFAEIGRTWYLESPVKVKRTTIRFPRKLLYPTEHFPVQNPAAQVLYDNFAAALQKHFKITKVPLNFTEALLPHFPDGDFSEFHRASNTLVEYRSWVSVGKPLVEKHEQLFGGETPKFDPRSKQMFARAASLTEDDFAAAVSLRRAFSDFVAADVLKIDTKSCSDAIFMYDAGTGGIPSYRAEDYNAMLPPTQSLLMAPPAVGGAAPLNFYTAVGSMAGLPEVTVPLGQVEYFSQVSQQVEMLPVAVQLVAHRGCDEILLDLVKKLGVKGVLGAVKTGKETF